MRLLPALFVLLVFVHCVVGQGSEAPASASHRINNRIDNHIHHTKNEVTAVLDNIHKLKTSFTQGTQQTKEDVEWLQNLEKRVSYINEDINVRMKTLFPASQENRAEAAGIISNSRITAMRSGTGMEARLARYGDPGYVSKEVVATASQELPRELIVAQLRNKFSNLQVGEVNDIIVSSFVHAGKDIPQLNEMAQSTALSAAKNSKRIKADNDRAPQEWFNAKK